MRTIVVREATVIDEYHLEFYLPRGRMTESVLQAGDVILVELLYDAAGTILCPEGWHRVAHRTLDVAGALCASTQLQRQINHDEAQARRFVFEIDGAAWLGGKSKLYVLRSL